MNGANATRRLVVVSAAVAVLAVLAVIGFRFLAGGSGAPGTAAEPVESPLESSPPDTGAASPTESFDDVLDHIEMPSREEEEALLREIREFVNFVDPEERKRKSRELRARFIMTPEEIAAAETIDLWRRMSLTLFLTIHSNSDLSDPERPIREILFWSDELVEFTIRPDALDASIDEYKRFAALLSQPDRGAHELQDMGPHPFALAGAGFELYTLDRMLASEAMIDRTLERADEFFRIYIERDRIIKAVMDEMGEDSPWNDGTRWDLAKGALRMADRISPERTEAWLSSLRAKGLKAVWESSTTPPDLFWDFVEQEFLDK